MATPSNPQVQAPNFTPLPSSSDAPTLDQLIEAMKAHGDTLELIYTAIMSNPYGIGAMDIASKKIAGISEQSTVLSQVQTDIITLDSILSKIESQLGIGNGTGGTVTKTMWNNLPKGLMTQFQTTYKKLFKSDASNPWIDPNNHSLGHYSDIAYLSTFKKDFATLDPVVANIKGWDANFSTKIPNGSGNGNTFEQDLYDPNFNTKWGDGTTSTNPFVKDICALAKDHYDANHSTDGKTSGTQDYLATWWTNGNTGQQLTSGQSQQDTTQVQSFMQVLQGFDSSGQQDLQLASTQKSQMIQNQKAS